MCPNTYLWLCFAQCEILMMNLHIFEAYHTKHSHSEVLHCFPFIRAQPTLPPLLAILCTPFSCWIRFDCDVKLAGHIEQVNGFSPLCILSCATKPFSLANFLAQKLHWNWGSWWTRSCCVRLLTDTKRFPQNVHANFGSFECSKALCILTREWDLKGKEHTSHLKPSPCSACICNFK